MNQFDQFQQAIQIKQIEDNLFSFIPDKKNIQLVIHPMAVIFLQSCIKR